MKKIQLLLHETTLINFNFLFTLIKRYYLISIVTFSFIFILASYYYSSQNLFYTKQVRFFRANKDDKISDKTVNSIFKSDKADITLADIKIIIESWTFQKKLAEMIYEEPNFYRLNFNRLDAKEKLPTTNLFANCQNEKKCIIESVRVLLPQFFTVIQGTLPHEFILKSTTLDLNTSKIFQKNMIQAILENRIQKSKSVKDRRTQILTDLLERKKKDFEEKGGRETLQRLEDVKENIGIIRIQLNKNKEILNNKNDRLKELTLKLEHAKNPKSINFLDEQRKNYQRSIELKERIKKIRFDLNILEKNPLKSDTEVMAQKKLKEELAKISIEVEAIGDIGSYINGLDDFGDKQSKLSHYLDVELKVLLGQTEALKKVIEKHEHEMSRLNEEKTELSLMSNKLLPDLKYIKILEEKAMSFKIFQSEIQADLVFEDPDPKDLIYKRTSIAKVIFFSIALSSFFLFTLLLCRYLLDDRIYNEDELQVYFKDMTVIGETPDFE